MSYYRPSYNQTIGMTRGRGYNNHRGSYRGNSNRGSWSSSRGGGSGYTPRGGGGRFDSFSNSFDSSRSKYNSSDRYSGSKGHDDYRKPYNRMDSSYSSNRDNHRSPDHKRQRTEATNSRHENSFGGGYGSGRYDSSYSDRRSFSNDRHPQQFSRRDEFRRPSGPPRGGYRGQISSRGSRGTKLRERPSRRLNDTSYAVRKRLLTSRSSDYARRLKISRMRSAIAAARHKKRSISDKDEEESEEEGKDDHVKMDLKESENVALKKEPDNEAVELSTSKKSDKQEDNTSPKDDKHDPSDENSLTKRKTFIKLNCPQCGIKAVTFRKYEMHLQSKTHLMAMRKVAIKQKSILSQMRLAQRNSQNELEKTSDNLVPRTNFCPLCKLNYKQRKSVHQGAESHRNMKKFLMPFCKICNMTFKSPMIYETHCCSIEHLKRKQRVENLDSDEGVEDVNLENFTTIDSVGVDEDEENKKELKEPVNVGIEQIRKVEAHYCDLCKMYISRGTEDEMPAIIARHCKQRTHMQRYVRYKEDKELEKRAEKLQRKETAEKERQNKVSTNGVADVSMDEVADKSDVSKTAIDDEEARDDKLWADVDKDLAEILADGESGNKSSDEDEEDINGERYDRFKYSEKSGDDKPKEGEIVETSVKESEVTEESTK